jgi:hypothetical protein
MAPDATFCPFDGTRLDAGSAPASAAAVQAPLSYSSLGSSPAPKKMNGCLTAILVIVGIFVVLGIIGSVTSQSSHPAASDAGLGSGDNTASRPAQDAAPHSQSPRVVLQETGSGAHTTKKFYVSDDWDLKWSYDCSSEGDGAGLFQVFINGDGQSPEIGPNELHVKGDGTEHLHGGAGYRYLEMNSSCNWAVKAISL